jgi:NADH-quinone oxidoreductase subunit L
VRIRLVPLYRLFVNKWYFDDLYDIVFVRTGGAIGRFAQQSFERVVVDGLIVGGTAGLARAGSAVVRGLQDGLLRVYAAVLLLGVAVVALYFLLQSS